MGREHELIRMNGDMLWYVMIFLYIFFILILLLYITAQVYYMIFTSTNGSYDNHKTSKMWNFEDGLQLVEPTMPRARPWNQCRPFCLAQALCPKVREMLDVSEKRTPLVGTTSFSFLRLYLNGGSASFLEEWKWMVTTGDDSFCPRLAEWYILS